MIKNNLKALGVHFFLTIISGLVSMMIPVAKWTSIKAHELQVMRSSYILFIVVIMFYFLFGTAFLHNLGSLKKNLMSVISVFLIGLLIWAFILCKFEFPKELIASDKWGVFTYYIAYAIPFATVNKLSNPVILLMFSLIPSAAMLLGIYAWKTNK